AAARWSPPPPRKSRSEGLVPAPGLEEARPGRRPHRSGVGPVYPSPRLDDLSRGLGQEVGVHEAVEVSVEYALGVPHLVVGAVMLDELIRVEHIASNLTPEVRFLHGA